MSTQHLDTPTTPLAVIMQGSELIAETAERIRELNLPDPFALATVRPSIAQLRAQCGYAAVPVDAPHHRRINPEPLSTAAAAAILAVLGVLFVAGIGLIAGIATGELPGYAAVAGLAVLGVVAIVTALAWDRTGAQR